MNIARVIEVNRRPVLIITAESDGGTHRPNIDGVDTNGACLARSYPGEDMPTGDHVQAWLVNKTQDLLGAAITYRPMRGNEIRINQVATPATAAPAA